MENHALLDNIFYCFVRDVCPVICRKYGSERVALFLNLTFDAGIDFETALDMFMFMFPLSEEEMEQEINEVNRNIDMYTLFK